MPSHDNPSSANQAAHRFWQDCSDSFLASPEYYETCETVLVRDILPRLGAPSRTLDAGCGSGRFTLCLASISGSVDAFDLSSSLIAKARTLGQERGIDNVRYWVDSLVDPQSDLSEYDLVSCMGVTSTVVDEWAFQAVLNTLAKATRCGGMLLLRDSVSILPDGQLVESSGYATRYRYRKEYHRAFERRGYRLEWNIRLVESGTLLNEFSLYRAFNPEDSYQESVPMYLEDQAAEFTAFLAENTAFWREHTGFPGSTDAVIYVDLAHDNPGYLLTNLWIAKYLQRFAPARVVGLACAWPKGCPSYSFDAVKRLADSFLLDDVLDLDRSAVDDEEMTMSFMRCIDGIAGADLRRSVLAFAKDIDPDLGWILYDTWLRQERQATLESPSAELIACARQVFRARRAITTAMQGGDVLAAVVGHYHYNPYAWMVREAVRKKAPVLFQSPLLPVSIRRLMTEEDFREGRPGTFLSSYEALVSGTVQPGSLKAFKRRMFDIQREVRQFFRSIPDAMSVQPRQDALRGLGLGPDAPVVCILVPALSAPTHCFGPFIFDDSGDWLKKSLEIAAETPSVNFLVKRHPMDTTYDVSNLVGQCEVAYSGRPNIRFLPANMPLGQLALMCDVAVTVSGTAGYELAARGVPTIAASRSRYSGLGFSIEPRSYDEYRSLLQQPSTIKINADQQRAAVLFFFFEMIAGRSQSLFIPPQRTVGTSDFWNEAAQHLRSRLPEEDPLFRNLRHMHANDLPFLLNTDVVPLASMQPMAARSPTDELLAGLHAVSLTAVRLLEHRLATAEADLACTASERDKAWQFIASWIDGGRRFSLGRGHPVSIFLLSGWSAPEDGGIWTDGPSATICIPSRHPAAQLCIECYTYGSDVAHVRAVSAWQGDVRVIQQQFSQPGTLQILRIPVRGHDGRIEVTLRIHEPIVPPGSTRHLGLWVRQFWLEATAGNDGALPE